VKFAEILDRDWKSVLRDLKYLEGFGLVELVKEGRHRIVDIVSSASISQVAPTLKCRVALSDSEMNVAEDNFERKNLS
jgi:DNA-binding transcriptional ArsR family regulator